MLARAHRSQIDGIIRLPPRRRRRRARGRILAVTLLAFAAIGAVAIARPFDGPFAGLASIFSTNAADAGGEAALPWRDRIASAAGFTVAWVELRGERYTQRSEIEAALALHTVASQLSFDIDAARRRVEALPWVRRAKLHRILPDGVGVEIIERTGAIVWRGADRDVLIDMDGRTLSAVPRGSDLGLPVVTGEGAGPVAPDLVSLIRAHREIERRVVEARRIENRRWTLLLAGGTLLHLPGDGVAAALAWIDAQAATGLLDRGLESIDLRVPGQLVVRPRPDDRADPVAQSRRRTGAATAAGGPP